MSMVISTNMSALNTSNLLSKNTGLMNSSLEKLSSGYSINSAADDAAGLAISEKMRSQIRGLDQASSNSQDAISLVQTADGALDETNSILERMRELAVKASSDTLTDDDRTAIQDETDQLAQELDRISNDTEFNTKKLLNGNSGSTTAVSGTDSASIDTSATVAGNNTATGDYTVNYTKVATQATTALTTASTAGITGATADASAYAGDISINGTTITIASGDTLEGVLDKINAQSVTTGVTATLDTTDTANQFIRLSATTYGSDSEITLAADNKTLTELFNATASSTATSVTATGTDAAGTINGAAATAKGNSLTAFDLTVTGIDGKIADGATAAVTVNASSALTFQVGANSKQTMSISINDMDANALGVAGDTAGTGIDLSTASNATNAITSIDAAIKKVSAERSNLGAVQNSLESNINNLDTESENLTSAESNIRDTDMASEMAEYTKLSVITQAATAMLAKANQQPQQVLTLLQ